MRYDEFRDRWLAALHEAGFAFFHSSPEETIDLSTTTRRWRAYRLPTPVEPLHAGAMLSFSWDSLDSARSRSTEEDLLTELLGRRRGRVATKQRLVRVDAKFHAALTYGSTAALPPGDLWGPWVASMEERLDAALAARRTRRQATQVPPWRGELEIDARCSADGTFLFHGMSLPAFEMIVIPRVWDDPKRRDKEASADRQIDGLARRFREGTEAWIASVRELVKWLRYAPVGSRCVGRRGKRGRGFPDDGDTGPETLH